MSKRLLTLVLGVFFFVGCSDSLSTPSELAVESSEDVFPVEVRVFEVTIKNLTSGQPFSPGVIVSHNPRVKLFRSGKTASMGIKDIAETGDPTAALGALTGAPGIHEVVGTGAPVHRMGGPGPSTLTVEISATFDARYLSMAVMLICTNDGFVGFDRVSLPGDYSPKVVYARGYDAGTEVDDELSSSIVDACGAIGPVMFPGDGDAHMDEGGVVSVHGGIAGVGDLTEAHDWTMGGNPERAGPLPAAKVTIQRVS